MIIWDIVGHLQGSKRPLPGKLRKNLKRGSRGLSAPWSKRARKRVEHDCFSSVFFCPVGGQQHPKLSLLLSIATEYDRASPPDPGSLKALLLPPLLNNVQTRERKGYRRGAARNFLHSFPLSSAPVVQSYWALLLSIIR